MNVPIFDPTGAPVTRAVALAARPPRLDGLRLGLVENTKFNADAILLRLADRLRERFGVTVAHVDRKRSPSHEVTGEAVAVLRRKTELVISGVGD